MPCIGAGIGLVIAVITPLKNLFVPQEVRRPAWAKPRCATLRHAVPCCAVLCHAVPCCTVLCHAALAMLRCPKLASGTLPSHSQCNPAAVAAAALLLQTAALGFLMGSVGSIQAALVFLTSFILGAVLSRVSSGQQAGLATCTW